MCRTEGCPRPSSPLAPRRSPSSCAATRPSCCRAASRCRPGGSTHRTGPRSWRPPTTVAWSWPATAGRRWATSSRSATSRRSSRPTSTPASASPAPPASRSRSSGSSRSSSSTTRRSRGSSLSLDGKANRLATLIRGNLAHGYARARRRAAVRRVRPGDRQRAHLLLRRHGRPVRGARVPLGRVGLDVRARVAQEAVRRRASASPTPSPSASRRCTTPPTTTRRPAAPTSPARSSRSSPSSSADGYRRVPEVEIGAVVQTVVQARLDRPDGPTGLRSS